MLGNFTTNDGFTLEAFSSLYMDWGLRITKGDEQVFYNPCCLSNESYGRKPADKFDDYDEAEKAELDGDHEAFVPWSETDWRSMLEREADDLLEAYVPESVA
jgi:hypothetical protein